MTSRQQGFTLIEMVVAITVSTIVVGFMAMFLVTPVEAYLAQERRIELNDSASNAKRMLANDIRNAFPDSVRRVTVGTSVALELLYADVARYRPSGSSGDPLRDLSLGVPVTQFALMGRFTNPEVPAGPVNSSYLAIGDAPGAYSMSNAITPAGRAIELTAPDPITGEQTVKVNPAVTFPVVAPLSRNMFYVVTPVSYVCDLTAGTLRRFRYYPISANQATHATVAQLTALGAENSLVARDVTACDFQYTAGTPQHGGLARLQITFTRNGELVRVFEQVQVENRL